MSDRAARLGIAALALAGAGIAGYLAYARLADAPLTCSTGGCETVQSSPYAELGGVPVALLGLGGYVLILATVTFTGELARAATLSLALTAFGFSAYLLAIQLVVIEAVCDWCLASDVATSLIAALALVRFRSALRPRPSG